MEEIRMVHRPKDGALRAFENPFRVESARSIRAYHASFPEYSPTPLLSMEALAKRLGAAQLWIKDESKRFGLNAFKVLGGSHAIGRCIARRLDMTFEEISYDRLTSAELRRRLGDVCFITATDGNHGRGVAWTARRLGQKCVVYMPQGSAAERLENIRRLGARADVLPMNYDEAVRFCAAEAERNAWILVQDTSWDGYEEIPLWIMQGYTTMGLEILEQLQGARPSHIFLQAGVGAMAGAMAAFFADAYGDAAPIIIVAEPENADCFFQTARANDGRLHGVGGDLRTIMAGLACGEPCPIGWEMLRRSAEYYASMPDWVAAEGMRMLGAAGIVSGESGAAAAGLAFAALQDANLRQSLRLDEHARILCISTEGDTDRENYRRILQENAYPKPEARGSRGII